MPTKTTSKNTTKKVAEAEADAKSKAAPKPAPKADKPNPVKSLLPKNTVRGAKPVKEQPKPAPEPTAEAPMKQEAVSLIDEKPKRVRKVATEAEKKSFFVPISRVREAEQKALEPQPVPEPAAPAAPAPEAT